MMTIEEAVALGSSIQGWKTQEELVWLARHASGSHIVIDVGCWRGRTTKIMAAVCPGMIIAVDHLTGQYTGETARNEILNKSRTLEIAMDFTANLADELYRGKVYAVLENGDEARKAVAAFLGGAKADFVWIDGDHAYEDAKADIVAYGALVQPGGILSGHDYEPSFPGVVKAVEELCPGFERGPGTSWWVRR
jgi:predicted O-methyltransferase YrrM